MNSIVLMAEVLTDPELRRTPDNQSSIASFLVQFAGGRSEEAPYRIKVVGWNNLADEMVEKYHKGDQVVVEGRLRLDTVDRGTYKEKRTELIAQRVHSFGAGGATGISSTEASATTTRNARVNPSSASVPTATPTYVPVATPATDAPDYDDIPF
ncbi:MULTISPECIES: single-stranded DNA-binding protein [Pseudanabaena]|jgi:single-strand DNA-binding protein|uniref:single-stranded DNA-binding protein n=1 Tax=Pseudanabaena TaxID=1152 RepID=UPI0024792C2E|nr:MULTISPECIES: single-stranded DNA-binding protein [Pseudanabaena]MEA5487444.1 single-stranded DNA-binding protein [Pseudanabaena sp. CCNP1317]WGS73127.1 single-stranded DNA-binding protein [Pseudanabaena galeata CCNP1313]